MVLPSLSVPRCCLPQVCGMCQDLVRYWKHLLVDFLCTLHCRCKFCRSQLEWWEADWDKLPSKLPSVTAKSLLKSIVLLTEWRSGMESFRTAVGDMPWAVALLSPACRLSAKLIMMMHLFWTGQWSWPCSTSTGGKLLCIVSVDRWSPRKPSYLGRLRWVSSNVRIVCLWN
jgi:hypothetical protein